jgi:hypothetical protein
MTWLCGGPDSDRLDFGLKAQSDLGELPAARVCCLEVDDIGHVIDWKQTETVGGFTQSGCVVVVGPKS